MCACICAMMKMQTNIERKLLLRVDVFCVQLLIMEKKVFWCVWVNSHHGPSGIKFNLSAKLLLCFLCNLKKFIQKTLKDLR